MTKPPQGFYVAYLERLAKQREEATLPLGHCAPKSYWNERREQEALKESVDGWFTCARFFTKTRFIEGGSKMWFEPVQLLQCKACAPRTGRSHI